MRIANACLSAVLLLVGSVEAGDWTRTAEKRSYVSNGVTCYYQCQPQVIGPDGNAWGLSFVQNDPQATVCLYSAAGACIYNPSNGVTLGSGGPINCLQQAAGPFCDSVPPGAFKRSFISGGSRDTKAIRSRQYRPQSKERCEACWVSGEQGPRSGQDI